MAQPQPENHQVKLDPYLRRYLRQSTDPKNLRVMIRLTSPQPPPKWSHLNWDHKPFLDQPNGDTVWLVQLPPTQILSLAESPDVAAISLGSPMSIL
jgi:hypothetical protein